MSHIAIDACPTWFYAPHPDRRAPLEKKQSTSAPNRKRVCVSPGTAASGPSGIVRRLHGASHVIVLSVPTASREARLAPRERGSIQGPKIPEPRPLFGWRKMLGLSLGGLTIASFEMQVPTACSGNRHSLPYNARPSV